MADVTGGTPPTGISPFDVPADIKKVYEHFGDPAMFEVASAAALPMTGNWVGRHLPVADTGIVYRWDGASWARVSRTAHAGKTGGFQSMAGGQFLTFALQSQSGGFTLADSGSSLMFPVAGEYRVTARMYLSGATAGTIACALHQAGSGAGQIMAWPVYKQDGSPSNDAVDTVSMIRPFPAGSGVRLWANAANASAWGVSGYDGAYLEAELIQ